MVDQLPNPSDAHRWVFPALYEQFAPRGIRYAYSILRNSADCEDVVQEAFCRLLALNRRQIDRNRFAPLFFTTVRNLSIDRLRRQQRRNDVSLDRIAEPVATRKNDADVQGLVCRVQFLIDELPKSWADALKLRVDGQLSYEQIAEVLSCTRAQVRTWIYRARREIESGLRGPVKNHAVDNSIGKISNAAGE